MSKLFKFSILSLSVFILSACGGGSGGGGGSDFIEGVDEVQPSLTLEAEPITPFSSVSSIASADNNNDDTLTLSSGFAGNIEATIINDPINGVDFPAQSFELVDADTGANIPSLNVVDVLRTQDVNIACSDGTEIVGTVTTDFLTGEEFTSGTVNGNVLNCVSNFATILPTTITDGESINSLLVGYTADDADLLDTTCPAEVLEIPDNLEGCDIISLTNFTVTDDTDTENLISSQIVVESN